MTTFHIREELSAESEIVCCDNAFGRLEGFRGLVFTDENVMSLYGEKIAESFKDAPVFAMPAGEAHKTPDTLFALLKACAEAELHRGDAILCIGGGVVGDVGGLASALYMRGIGCIQVPTTLLAQVDSSVGGKTAVDFCGIKNLVGAFRQPGQVLVDPVFLKTLPARELRCGLGEIVKHSALDGALFDKLVRNADRLFDLDFLAEIIPDNIAIKARVVQADAREAGLRQCLNLGHTTAHAFELADGTLSHGEYVLVGILYEAEIAKRLTECDGEYLNKLCRLAKAALGNRPVLPEAKRVAVLSRLDKKNLSADTVSLVAPVRKGEYELLRIPYDDYAVLLSEVEREVLC